MMQVFESYLGAPQTPTVAGQHVLDADYFRRIDAMNFTMAHDDGRLPDNLSDADIILLGISRTSKTPTGIYLAQRGYKTANLPLVPQVPFPEALTEPHKAFVVCLIASRPDRRSAGATAPCSWLIAIWRIMSIATHFRRDRVFAAHLRKVRLAGDRRHAPVDRRIGDNDIEAASRS